MHMKYTFQIDENEKSKLPIYEKAYMSNKSIFKDGKTRKSTILGSHQEYSEAMRKGQVNVP